MRRRLLLTLSTFILLAPAPAFAGEALAPDETAAEEPKTFSKTGGASGEHAPGGSADSKKSGALAYGAPAPARPIAGIFRLTPVVRKGRLPIVRMRIDEPGVKYVRVKVVFVNNDRRTVAARVDVGRVRTGRLTTMRWPRRAKLAAGHYSVRLHARDPEGATIARTANATGRASLIVKGVRLQPRPEMSQPQPLPQPTEKVSSGGVFPVAGPHSFGGDDSRFGAGRRGHSHEGHDISASEGTPVVTPVPGTVAFVDNQPHGAGWYVVINGDDGRAYFFAHLKTNSITVGPNTRVGAGSTIGQVGTTGSSSGPHLHFEIWQGGWRDRNGTPIDPLPELRAWDH